MLLWATGKVSAYFDYPNCCGNGRVNGAASTTTGEPYLWSMFSSRTIGENVLAGTDYNQLIMNGSSVAVGTSQPDSETGTAGEFYLGGDGSARTVEDIAEYIIYDKTLILKLIYMYVPSF